MYFSGAVVAFVIGFFGSLLQANWRRNDLNEDESLLYSYSSSALGGLFWALLSWAGVFLALVVYTRWWKSVR